MDVRSAGKELGARYVMEGSLRQAGTKLRIAVQLVDATTGAHLWAETYDTFFTRKPFSNFKTNWFRGSLPRSPTPGACCRTP